MIIIGLAVLQQLQDLMRTRRFVGLLILGIAALISAITSVTVAAISLTQQVHTAQYVDSMSKNVSLALATQEAIDRKLEMRVDALEEAVIHMEDPPRSPAALGSRPHQEGDSLGQE